MRVAPLTTPVKDNNVIVQDFMFIFPFVTSMQMLLYRDHSKNQRDHMTRADHGRVSGSGNRS